MRINQSCAPANLLILVTVIIIAGKIQIHGLLINKCCSSYQHVLREQKCLLQEDKDTIESENIFQERVNEAVIRSGNEDTHCYERNMTIKFNNSRFDRDYVFKKLSKNASSVKLSKLQSDDTSFLLSDGSILWTEFDFISQQSVKYSSHEFCIEHNNGGNELIAVIFSRDCNESHPCVSKCCLPSMVLASFGNGTATCVSTPTTTRRAKNTSFKFGFPACNRWILDPRFNDEQFYAEYDGTLLLQTMNSSNQILAADKFCIDSMIDDYSSNNIRNPEDLYEIAVICFPIVSQWENKLYASMYIISAIFLLLTAFVYLALWKERNLPRLLQLFYVISLFFAQSLLAIYTMWNFEFKEFSRILCQFLGSAIHFACLSSFFWLTSINLDIWHTFRTWRPNQRKQGMVYAMFSVVCPLLLSGIVFTLQILYWEKPEEAPIPVPFVNEDNCYFNSLEAHLLYYSGVVLLLVVMNFSLFILTVTSLRRRLETIRCAGAGDNCNHQIKQRYSHIPLRIYIKLFIVLGAFEVTDVCLWISSLLISKDFEGNPEELISDISAGKWIFVILRCLVSLKGLAIFIVFVCKEDIKRRLLIF